MNETIEDEQYEDGITVVIDYSQKVNIVRFIGNELQPAQITIKAEVMPNPESKEIDFDVAFAKIKFWFDNVVSRSVVCSRTNATALKMLIDAESGAPMLINRLMFTPYEPRDEHLGVLFQAKMEALSSGSFHFGCVQVQSGGNGLMFTYVGEWQRDLPEMAEWFSATPYYFEQPWWARDDASTIDMMIGDDTSVPPPWAFTLDFIESSLRPQTPAEQTEKPPEEVVIKFKPKVIDGGKDKENP